MRFSLFFIFLLSLIGPALRAQSTTDNFPVQCTPLINTAYSLNLNDYATNTQLLTVNLRLKDLTKPQLQVYLRVRIEGLGVVIQTRNGFVPTSHLTLLPGQPTTLHGPDLQEYFYPTNLDIQGIDQAFLFQGGTLPEGLYRFYWQAFDLDRGRPVSNEGVALVNVFKRQPPLLIYPANNANLKPISPQNLLFQWLPRDMASLNAAAGGTTYTFRLFELPNEDDDPASTAAVSTAANIAAQSGQPILERTLTQTSLFLGPSDIPLVRGRKYAWQVQVSSLDGRDVFLNQGYSQVSSFRYGGGCLSPSPITVAGKGGGRVLVSWSATDDAQYYQLRYRLADASDWQQQVSYSTGSELRSLADGSYVYQVSSVCSGGQVGSWGSEQGLRVVAGQGNRSEVGASGSSARLASSAASSSPLPTASGPTAQELALNRLLNPGSVLVNTSGQSTDDIVTATLASLNELKPPPCAEVVATDPTCVSVTPDYTGIPAKGSLSVGDVIFVNTYKVVVTQVSGGGGTFSGEGIVTLPYLNNTLFAVDFKNISVVGSPDKPGGCVTSGDLLVAGSSNAALDNAVQTRLVALYQKAQTGTQQDEFIGKLSEALQQLTDKAKAMQTKATVGKNDYKDLQKSLKAVQTYMKAFDGDLETVFGKDSPELAQLRQTLSSLRAVADDCNSCLEEQLNSTSIPQKGSGPWWSENYFLVCDAKAMLTKALSLQPGLDDLNQQSQSAMASVSCWGILGWREECKKVERFILKVQEAFNKKVPLEAKPTKKSVGSLEITDLELGSVSYAKLSVSYLGDPTQSYTIDVTQYKATATGFSLLDKATQKVLFEVKVDLTMAPKLLNFVFGNQPSESPDPTFPITGVQLKSIFPTADQSRCDEVAALLNKYSYQFGVTDAVRMSHFLGQIGAETNLTSLVEGTYSASRIQDVWTNATRTYNGKTVLKYCDLFEGYTAVQTSDCPFPYCDPPLYAGTTGLQVKAKYIKSTALFDYVYACRLGNGSIDSKDGSRFRGRGFMQLTGYNNYQDELQDNWDKAYGKGNKDFMCRSAECDANLELVGANLEIAMQTALAFWKGNDINALATDVSDSTIKAVSKIVNGGDNGQDARLNYTQAAYKIFNK